MLGGSTTQMISGQTHGEWQLGMVMLLPCALCKKNVPLMQSHIFPKLIYKRIRSHPKSRFRSLDNFSKAMQDGEKRPMLCHDCEARFSSFEL